MDGSRPSDARQYKEGLPNGSRIVLNICSDIHHSSDRDACLLGSHVSDSNTTDSNLTVVVQYLGPRLQDVMFIDPYLSMLTDELVEGKVSDPYFRRSIVWLTGSRIVGTVMAQFLLIPAALWIVIVAEWL